MTRKMIVIAALAGAGLLAGQALAVEPSFPRNPKVFGKIDTDSNGKITLAEIKPKAEKRLLRLDADKNNEISTAEIDAFLQKRLEQRRTHMLGLLDGDKNGVVTMAELDKLVDAMFNSADADKDGGVTLEEARDFRIAKLPKPEAGAN
ncbi:MAG: EF-hand domain-containing protein [Aestuariivirga sp.]